MVEYREEVDELLKVYAEYKQLLQVKAELSVKLAKQKITGDVDAELASDHERAKRKLQSLSNSMTFANPLVWIMYKFEAYKNEAQPIRTMRDFRIHCSKEGDICTKRFAFVNERLTVSAQRSLLDTGYYKDSSSLDMLLVEKSLRELVEDPAFMSLWQTHEYNTDDTRVAKWESYSITA